MSDPNAERKMKWRFLAGFGVYFAAVLLAWDTPVLYPLKIFVVMLHEISHAAAAVATGGFVDGIELDPRQGGLCRCPGGNAFVTLSAGYLGSLAWGLLLLSAAGAKWVPSRAVVVAVGALVTVLALLYVDGSFGLGFGVAFGGALMLAGLKLRPSFQKPILVTLGLTSCLYAILDIKSDVLDRPHLQSDAAMLAEMTPGISTTTWGVIWIAVAALVSAVAFRRAYRQA